MQSNSGILAGGNHRRMAVGNSLSVLELIHRRTLISQRQIAQATGMQPSTVSNIIRELKESGMVRESGTLEAAGVGAKQVSLEIDSSFAWVAGWMIDRKGHQLCLMDAAGHVVTVEKFPLDWDWEGIAKDMARIVERLAQSRRLPMARFAGLGVCVQGIVDKQRGEVIYSHPHNMQGVPLRDMLERDLPAPVHVERNIPCGAYLEQHVSAVGRRNSFLYYLLRRHEDFFEHGAGIVLNGEVFRGSHSAAGELAIGLFPRPDPQTIRREKQWDVLYGSFGKPVAMLADFLDVDGVIVSSDDPGLTERRFRLLEREVLAAIRPIQGRTMTVTRSKAGPEGMLLGAGLIALEHYFRRFVLKLPNRSVLSPRKRPAKAAFARAQAPIFS